MSYLVFCTFDLKAASSQDYQNAYEDLASLALRKVQKSQDGSNSVIPTTAAMGFFTGPSAGDIRDELLGKVRAKFQSRKLKSEIFIVVGDNWAWGSHTT